MPHHTPRPQARSKKKLRPTLAKVLPLTPKRTNLRTLKPGRNLSVVSPLAVQKAIVQMATNIAASETGAEAQKSQLLVVQELLKAKACFIATAASPNSALQIATVRGRNDPRIAAPAVGHGPVGRAFAKERIERAEGVIAAPLRGAPGVLGCLAIVDPKIHAGDDVIEMLAAQVSAAVEVARLRDEAVRRTKDLQTAVAGLRSLEKHREEMLANVSHDLKNPLTTVKAYLAMLTRNKMGPVSDAQARALQVCDRNADRLLQMINDLLLLSRLQSGKMQLSDRPFGVKNVVEEVVQSLATFSDHAQVKLSVAPSAEVYIRGDKEKFAEAIYNLADAAISRSKAGDTVHLDIATTEPGIGIITVRDKGRILTPQELEHLFDGYHHSRSLRGARLGSSGLALPLVAKIAQVHGGRVQVSSSEKDGTRFQVFVPMFAGAVAPAMLAHPPQSGGILLVEDDADVRDVLQKLLEEEDYRVDVASTASDAIRQLSTHPPAMVLLDLRLADSDGRTVLHHIREDERLLSVPVFVISGASDVAQLSMGQGKDRIDGYFEKPVQLNKLLDTVASVVRPAGKTSVST